ncbi:hypothetical protein P171DRAFT_470361 [Karstenula rhodostoma CBS 690.94]|uniref:Uncharacterized protein n=1 Tax=Karstenula rhodostoma CBS 690.94 TaxID=1392251 RepID=A0A9P4PR49_9PLEO|nr:hypothetical protein P171DRAFT_470361 [Karstenula rhodostoma CBS 690.94]
MSPLAHYIISTTQPRRRSTVSLHSSTTTSSMNSDIGLQATTADIGTPKGSSVDLTTHRKQSGDKTVGKEQTYMHVRSGDRGNGQRESLGKAEEKRKGEERVSSMYMHLAHLVSLSAFSFEIIIEKMHYDDGFIRIRLIALPNRVVITTGATSCPSRREKYVSGYQTAFVLS